MAIARRELGSPDAPALVLVTIPEAGHTPVWEAPERTAELILTGAGAR